MSIGIKIMTFKLYNSLKTKNVDKNHRISLSKFSKNTLKNEIIDKNIQNSKFVKKEKIGKKSIDLSTPWAESYGYSFHLYMKSPDTVLVKDIGITCTLRQLEEKKIISLNDSEDKLLNPKHKKSNSSMSKKLNAYKKNLFDILSMKIIKTSSQSEKIEKDDRFDKIPVATEYINSEGKLCLKLRFKYVDKRLKKSSRTSITPKMTKTESQNRNKSKLKIFFLEMQTNNKKKSSLSSISSLFNNLTKSEHSKKGIKVDNKKMNENVFSSEDNNKILLPENKIIATSTYCKKVHILHSSYSPRAHHNY